VTRSRRRRDPLLGRRPSESSSDESRETRTGSGGGGPLVSGGARQRWGTTTTRGATGPDHPSSRANASCPCRSTRRSWGRTWELPKLRNGVICLGKLVGYYSLRDRVAGLRPEGLRRIFFRLCW
jgi:hypothetical protein